MPAAGDVIAALGMVPHPEGGWYVETWRSPTPSADRAARPAASAILYLLGAGERSHWHRVDADEIWQWSGGGPLALRTWSTGETSVSVHRLGGEVTAGERPQVVVPAGAWQAAEPLAAWALVGCIVAPAFDFAGFELASPDWSPDAPEIDVT